MPHTSKQSELALCAVWCLKRKDQLTRADLLPTKAHQQRRQSTQSSGGAASPSAAPLLGVSPSWPRLQPSSAPAYRTSEWVRAPGGKPQCARTRFRNCTNRLTQCRWVTKAPPDATGCPWPPLCATWHATPAFFAYLWKQGKTAQRRAHQQRSTMMGVLVCGMLAALN